MSWDYNPNNFLHHSDFCLIAPLQVALNGSSTDTVGYRERVYFQFPFPTYGVTIQLSITSGTVVCYASDRYENPNEEQGYDWRVETSSYVDVFLDPSLLSYSAGSIVYVAIEGNAVSNTFTLGNMEGDRRGITLICTYSDNFTFKCAITCSPNIIGIEHSSKQHSWNGRACVLSIHVSKYWTYNPTRCWRRIHCVLCIRLSSKSK